jgi:hypothetical protein
MLAFTFGIITAGGQDETLRAVIDSIRRQNIPLTHYEIIIVGHTKHSGQDIINIPFNEQQKPAWITRKKNLIAQQAKFQNIVLLHDYVALTDNWYIGFNAHGDDFAICITKIQTNAGQRFRDYTVFGEGMPSPFNVRSLIPYPTTAPTEPPRAQQLSYVSGTYYIIKKYIALKYPLDERLSWCQCEDLDLSMRLRDKGIYPTCNPHSTVTLLKDKPQAAWEQPLTEQDISTIDGLCQEEFTTIQQQQRRHIDSLIAKYW